MARPIAERATADQLAHAGTVCALSLRSAVPARPYPEACPRPTAVGFHDKAVRIIATSLPAR